MQAASKSPAIHDHKSIAYSAAILTPESITQTSPKKFLEAKSVHDRIHLVQAVPTGLNAWE